ncbi:response regulator [uncultured Imperialibacter sp.]|uniref:response regulator n=1 Tax=uncultured Imperialibacter sp. TaxID=1672639 RepID=UPI0030D806D5|tara:strand:+ start:67298 stop:67690 length:393 start_codon:yes stop_codon:yes gene_type:complete
MPVNRIILVDDDEISNFLSISLIKKIDPEIEIIPFRNGKEALDYLQNESLSKRRSNLILLDIRMPVMNGFEFLEEVHNSDLRIKDSMRVVMLSSSDNPRDLERAKSFKVLGYINKPLKEESISTYLSLAG